MRITDTVEITKKKVDNSFIINMMKANGETMDYCITEVDNGYNVVNGLYSACIKADDDTKKANWEILKSQMPFSVDDVSDTVTIEISDDEKVMRGLNGLISFFSEFNFEPNFRFVNTISRRLAEKNGEKETKEFIENYFALLDSPYFKEIKEKMKSSEFKQILKDLSVATPTKTVNNRFKIYYGSAGTGKTTKAMKETNNKCVVCNASMLPSDLMEDFVFSNGEPTFQKSELWNCMEQGLPLVLDEINLLPFESLRFLQGVLDGKTSFDYKGHTVTIADGFEVIGTMNLTIGGMTYGLPEPLVDRCAYMKKYTLSAEDLKGAF